jgi:hypothetical protein
MIVFRSSFRVEFVRGCFDYEVDEKDKSVVKIESSFLFAEVNAAVAFQVATVVQVPKSFSWCNH